MNTSSTSTTTSTATAALASATSSNTATTAQEKKTSPIYEEFLRQVKASGGSEFRFRNKESEKFNEWAAEIVNDHITTAFQIREFGLDVKIRKFNLEGSECILFTLRDGTDDTAPGIDARGHPNWTLDLLKKIGSIAAARYFISLPEFNDFEVHVKPKGKDAGFVLKNPHTKVQWFFKRTGNEAVEFFISQCFSHLGIKYPETKLFQDCGGNLWLATLDMSRTYSKSGGIETAKVKKFKTIQDNFFDQNKIFVYDMDIKDIANVCHNDMDGDGNATDVLKYQFFSKRVKDTEHGPAFENKEWKHVRKNPKLEPLYKELIKRFVTADEEAFVNTYKGPTAKAARLNFAKCLIVREIFSITDMGGHAGNFGLITTTAGSKTIEKIGLIDFSQAAFIKRYEKKPLFIGGYEHKEAPSLTAFVKGKYKLQAMLPVFNALAKLVSGDEMKAALQALLKPKQRVTDNGGYLLTNGQTTDYTTCIEQAFSNFLGAMQGVTMKDKDELIRNIGECKGIYIERMKAAEAWFVAEPPQNQEHLNAFKAREVEQQVIPSSFYNKGLYAGGTWKVIKQ